MWAICIIQVLHKNCSVLYHLHHIILNTKVIKNCVSFVLLKGEQIRLSLMWSEYHSSLINKGSRFLKIIIVCLCFFFGVWVWKNPLLHPFLFGGLLSLHQWGHIYLVLFCFLPFCDVTAEVTIIRKTIEPNLAIDSVPKVQTLKHPSHFWLQKSENPMEKSVYFPRLLENLGNQKAKKPHISRHLEQKKPTG